MPGQHLVIEKEREMSRPISLGTSPINVQDYVNEKSNQNLLIIGATGQGKSKLMRLMLEMFPNPKTIFSFKKRDEYLQIEGNMIYAEKSLPNPFSDPDAFTSAFAVACGISSEGIQSNMAISVARQLSTESSSWKEFIANAKKLEKSKDSNTRAATAYVLQKTKNFAYDPHQINLDLNITNVIDFSYLNEEAKTFYAELFLRQIYKPKGNRIVAVLSSKVTLRERIAQTGYWKIKLASDSATKHIKVFFITPDEDGTLTQRKPAKKGRAIVEIDTDGSYILSETKVEESSKVKMLDKFIEDLSKLSKE